MPFPIYSLPFSHISWLRVALRIERSIENVNNFKSGRHGLKAREIEAKYPVEKAKRLMQLLRQKGLYYYDEDFPEDEEEFFLSKHYVSFLFQNVPTKDPSINHKAKSISTHVLKLPS